jgi:hypothetical protein
VSKESNITALQTLIKATVGFEEYCARNAIFTHCFASLTDLSAGAKAVYILTIHREV